MSASTASYPIDEIRELFPSLKRCYKGKQAVYFDGPAGSQAVKTSAEAIYRYMVEGMANTHGLFSTSIETEALIDEARLALADLLGVQSQEIVFGANMTSLSFSLSRNISRNLRPDDEIVLSQMDHRGNVDPWLAVARDKNLKVRWITVDPLSLTLDLHDLDRIITPKTRVVAVGLASNSIGTINNVAAITARAHDVGAITVVDAVHAVPHIAIDRDSLGADIILCAAYKFFGPHVGIAAVRASLLEQLDPYIVLPNPKFIPDKFETGTQNHEAIAGLTPVVEFIAGLGTGETRRQRIVDAMERIEAYENSLSDLMRDEMAKIPRVTLYQAGPEVRKTSTIAFHIEGLPLHEICRQLVEDYSIFLSSGDFYNTTMANILGVNRIGGWVRVGLEPYSTHEEAHRFITALKEIVRNTGGME
jgi:cysteine desulfurase family protein (TIGR01976 family)